MTRRGGVLSYIALAAICLMAVPATVSEAAEPSRTYNTAKAKLMSGKPIVGGTVSTSDPNIYCAMANSGWDYLWIEMQHSPLTYSEVAKMIRACKDAPAIPFIRVPDATEGDIQKAMDIGALGIVVPMVASVEEAEALVKYANYPPEGIRSHGGGQYGAIWGSDYRQTVNDNLLLIVMIEQPAAVEIVGEIAAVPGIDVVFAASGDLVSFTGWARNDPRYTAMVGEIRDATLKAGKKLGGPFSWFGREGFTFFQGPGESSLIRSGTRAALTATEREDVATGDQ